jgi:anti-anti-sigma factor
MEVRALPQPGAFALEGELDMATVDVLLSATRDAPPDRDLVLDLSKLAFIDSMGMRAILQMANSRNAGSSVVLKDPSPAVARVLDIALPGGARGLRVQSGGSGHG